MKHKFVPAAPWRAALIALVLGAGVINTQTALAQANARPPERMTYQGFLVDGNGTALGNTAPKNYDVIFRVWSSESGSSNPERLWSEQQTVTVDKGYFSVLLGEGTEVAGEARPTLPTLFKGATASDRWVGITVKGIGAGGANVDILPRMRLLSSPYAFLAEQATKLVREDNSSDLLTSSGNVLSFNGHLDVLGNNSLEFGADVIGKQPDAGRMGYNLYGNAGNLDIVGAGTTAGTRKIKLWAEGGLTVAGPVTANSFSGDGSSLTGVAKLDANTFSGTQSITAGDLRMDNTRTFQAKNNAGTYELFMWPRWSDNITYLNYGSGGFNIRNNASTTTMFMKDDGNVGLGWTDPTSRLHVNGSVAIRTGGRLQFGEGYTREVSAGQIGYGIHSGGASGSLDIVGAGTTSSNRKISMWAEGGLNLNGHISNGLDVRTGFGRTFEVPSDYIQVLNWTDKTRASAMYRASDGLYLWLRGSSHHSSVDRYAIWNGDSNWDFSSDRRLKKDIVDAEPMLDRALKVQIRRFHWKEDPETDKLKLGVIAQELQPLFPDMVSEMEQPRGGGEKTLAVGYSDFGMIAVKALQEFKVQHDAEVKELKAQVADLQAQMKQVLQAAAELKSAGERSKTTAAVTK